MRSLEATRRQVQEAVEEGSFQTPLKKYKDEPELPDHAHTEQQTATERDDNENPDSARVDDKPASGSGEQGSGDERGPSNDGQPETPEPTKTPRDQQTPSS